MINITHGIYNVLKDSPYHADGVFDGESRKYLPLPVKFVDLLKEKGEKFLRKYNIAFIKFVYAIDYNTHISAISICHPFFDYYDREIGEKIAIGRVRRMRGDIKEVVYEIEHYNETIYRMNAQGIPIRIKEVPKKRVKRDGDNEPIVRRTVWFKPYDLEEVICDREGDFIRYKYPYIYKLEA